MIFFFVFTCSSKKTREIVVGFKDDNHHEINMCKATKNKHKQPNRTYGYIDKAKHNHAPKNLKKGKNEFTTKRKKYAQMVFFLQRKQNK
eukprot:m.272330 g.272330  ORF g.272330 m.272330 type:complete len:89 (+) comp100720_c0_seq1:24-290(+)